MPRIIEIVLFLAPLAAFVVWRLYFRTRVLPLSFVIGLGCVVALILGALLWTHHQVAGDGQLQYQPAVMRDGRIVPGGPLRPDDPGRPP